MGALTNAMRLQRRSSGASSGTIEGVPAKTVVLLYTADLLEHVKSDGGVCFLRFSEVLITSDTTIFIKEKQNGGLVNTKNLIDKG